MNYENPNFDLSDKTGFPISSLSWTPQNANNLSTGHANTNFPPPCFPPNSVPSTSVNSCTTQFIGPSDGSNMMPNSHSSQSFFNRPPPNFNFRNRPNVPHPFFSPVNFRPPPNNIITRHNDLPPFPGQCANPNDLPQFNPPYDLRFTRPFLDKNCLPPRSSQTHFNERCERHSFPNNLFNQSGRPPVPANYLPQLNDICQSSEFKTNFPPNGKSATNSLGNTTSSDLLLTQQPPSGFSGGSNPSFGHPAAPTIPSSNNSYTSFTGPPLPFLISTPLPTQRPLQDQLGDGLSRPFKESNQPRTQFPPPNSPENKGEHGSEIPGRPKLVVPPIPFHPLHNEVISSKKDQDWIHKWLEERSRLQTEEQNVTVDENSEEKADAKDHATENQFDNRPKCILKLSDVHGLVGKYSELLDQLCLCHTKEENEATSIKVKLDEISAQLLDPAYQSAVRRLVSARRKKRARARSSRRARLQRLEERSADIDRERERLCRQYKTEETQKRLVAEADAVLRDVRGKKEETVSLQLLLAALSDLRQHRLNKGDHQGYVASQHHTEHFQKVTDTLDEMLESNLKVYELEERALQAMLDQQRGIDLVPATTREDKRKDETKTQTVAEALFGDSVPADPALFASYTAADNSREMLLARRCAWDKHIVEVGGSGIPVCWVTPPDNPSTDWVRWKKS